MRDHNIGFYVEIRKTVPQFIPVPHPTCSIAFTYSLKLWISQVHSVAINEFPKQLTFSHLQNVRHHFSDQVSAKQIMQ